MLLYYIIICIYQYEWEEEKENWNDLLKKFIYEAFLAFTCNNYQVKIIETRSKIYTIRKEQKKWAKENNKRTNTHNKCDKIRSFCILSSIESNVVYFYLWVMGFLLNVVRDMDIVVNEWLWYYYYCRSFFFCFSLTTLFFFCCWFCFSSYHVSVKNEFTFKWTRFSFLYMCKHVNFFDFYNK